VAWDANRPVPWQRLVREWFVYVAIMAAVFVVFFRDRGLVGILGGLLASGPIYLAIGYVLAKLGFQRKQFKELREDARIGRSEPAAEPVDRGDRPRPRPAPTKRTGGGSRPNRPAKRRR
jgi:hypothetical protein